MSTESRTDRLTEEYKREVSGDDEITEEQDEAIAQKTANIVVKNENRRFWILYRALDEASQADVKELVDPAAATSQSTVSRIIRDKEDAVLSDTDSLSSIHGRLHEDDVKHHPDEWLEAYRDLIAEAQADHRALSIIADPERKTPEWAAKRYPRLVGCHHEKADKWDHEVETADDSHLNHLDSVNTDRWK